MLDCDGSKEFWDRVISELPREISGHFEEAAKQQLRVSNLLRRCLGVPSGMEFLLNRVRAHASASLAWADLARIAFHLLARFPEASQPLAEQLVDLIEAIDPKPVLLRRLRQNLSSELGFKPINGYQTILHLFQFADKTTGIHFIRLLALEVEDPEQRESLQQWSRDAASVFSIQPEAMPAAGAMPSNPFLLVR